MDFSLYKQAISQLSSSVVNRETLNTATTLNLDMSIDLGETTESLVFTIINKNISTPIGMSDVFVQGDKLSRMIAFEMNRYFDGIDLSTKKFFINFMNANGQAGTDDITQLFITDTKITFEWWVPGQLTLLDGEVSLQLEIAEFDAVGDIVYRFLTTPVMVEVAKSIIPNGTVDQNDYYLDIRFLNKYTEDITYNMASELDAIKIEGRQIVMPFLEDLVVTQDSRSKVLTFIIDRYFDSVDFADKTIAIKFQLPDGRGDRSFVANTVISDTKIRFDWILDSRVTLVEGAVNFAIEFIGYNERDEFTCWNTLTSTLFVSKGLDVDSLIEQPTANWFQQWNILADKYLKNFAKYMDMVEKLSARMETMAEEVELAKNKAISSATTAKVWSDIAWNQADRADQIKTEITILKADFDTKKTDFDEKYKRFISELIDLRKKSDKIEYADLSATLAAYLDGKSDKGHTHDVGEIHNARSKNDPITADDLSLELLDLINSGSGDGTGTGSGSGSSGLKLSEIFDNSSASSNKGWTGSKINQELETLKESMVEKDDDKVLSDNNFSDYYRKKLDSIEENANYFDTDDLSDVLLSVFKQDPLHRTVTDAQIKQFKDKYTKSEIDKMLEGISTGLSWNDPVDTFGDLTTTYPNPSNGDTVNVTNDPDSSKNGTYTYNDDNGTWVQISSSGGGGGLTADQEQLLNDLDEFMTNYEEPDLDGLKEDILSDIQDTLDGFEKDVNDGVDEKLEAFKKEINDIIDGLKDDLDEDYRSKDDPITLDDLDPEVVDKIGTGGSSTGSGSGEGEEGFDPNIADTTIGEWGNDIDPDFDWDNIWNDPSGGDSSGDGTSGDSTGGDNTGSGSGGSDSGDDGDDSGNDDGSGSGSSSGGTSGGTTGDGSEEGSNALIYSKSNPTTISFPLDLSTVSPTATLIEYIVFTDGEYVDFTFTNGTVTLGDMSTLTVSEGYLRAFFDDNSYTDVLLNVTD